MSKTCPVLIHPLPQVNNGIKKTDERTCGRQIIDGSDRCIFHDPNAWKHHAESIRNELRKKIENGDLNFHKYHFPEINFSEIADELKEPAYFKEAVFHEDASFTGLKFGSLADFSETKFVGIARFDHTRFLGDVHFDNSKFIESARFENAKFSEGVWFAGVEMRSARFVHASFSGNVMFIGAKFSGGSRFLRVVFSKDVRFDYATFLGFAGFSDAEFLGYARFLGTKFSGYAFFYHTEFKGGARFDNSKFLGSARFENAKFSGYTRFIGTIFSGFAGFSHTIFGGSTRFDNAEFSKYVQFDVSHFHEIVSFDGLLLNDVNFTCRNALFERGISADEKSWSEAGHHLLIEGANLTLAADSYHALGNGFERMGNYRTAGKLFYREMVCRKNMVSFRRNIVSLMKRVTTSSKPILKQFGHVIRTVISNKHRDFYDEAKIPIGQNGVTRRNFSKWLWMRIFDYSCGFGEKPSRVFLGCLLTVLIFTGLYLPFITTTTNIWNHLTTAFLLSIDAFTPGRFLNISFTSPGDLLVQVENVLGWFMLALVLLVFTRKMSRS